MFGGSPITPRTAYGDGIQAGSRNSIFNAVHFPCNYLTYIKFNTNILHNALYLLINAHRQAALYVILVPYIVVNHLKILIPVGMAIIIVPDVKYACLLTSILTVNMWCAHNSNPSNPIAITEKTIPTFPKSSFFLLAWQMICEIIPNSVE